MRVAARVVLSFTLLAWLLVVAASHPVQAQTVSYTDFHTGPAEPVLTGGGPGAWDQFIREKVSVIQDETGFRMWYVGHSAAGQSTSKVGYATSTDGVTWTKYPGNPIISRSVSDQDICVVVHPDGTYWMYIEVNNSYIDLLISPDGVNWTASGANPVKTSAASPVVWREGSTWYMFYEHMMGATFDLHLAVSPDGLVWTDSPANPVLSEGSFTVADSIVKEGTRYHLYYHTAGLGTRHATSEDLLTWTNRELLLPDVTITSPFVFRTITGELWAYLWVDDATPRYYLRRGVPLQYPLVWLLDDGSGTIARGERDQVHGTLVNGAVWTTGVIGGGLSFDGVDDYVSTLFTKNLPAWTVSVWVRSPAAPANAAGSGPVQREANFQIVWNHGDSRFRGAAALRIGGSWYPASFGSLAADRWYHLAASYDGETLQAYRDGVLVASNTAPSGPPDGETRPLLFGRSAVRDQFFAGTIDDVRIYDRALAAADITALMSF
jgi:hypothetical protein